MVHCRCDKEVLEITITGLGPVASMLWRLQGIGTVLWVRC